MRNKINQQLSDDDRMTILANLFIDRIIEKHQNGLKIKNKATTIRLGLSKQ